MSNRLNFKVGDYSSLHLHPNLNRHSSFHFAHTLVSSSSARRMR